MYYLEYDLKIGIFIFVGIIISTIRLMSYTDEINVNPHIYIYAKSLNKNQSAEVDLKKIEYLSKTRLLDDLLKESQKIPNMKFQSLSENIKKQKLQIQKDKENLNYANVDQQLESLDVDCDDEEIDTKVIDERQLKVYKLAKILFDQGNYQRSLQIIKKLQKQALNDYLYIHTTWARFYCEIVLKKPETKKTAQRLKVKIDEYQREDLEYGQTQNNRKKAKMTQKHYAQKEQYLNLLPLVFFENPSDEDCEKFLDISTNQSYFSVVQLVNPHLLSYICASIILNKTLQKNRNFDLVKLIETIKRKIIKNQNAFTQFLSALYLDYNFDLAATKIQNIKKQVNSDCLLAPLCDKIIQNCHYLYYKVYCKIFERVPLKRIAISLGKQVDEAELWALKLIRSLDIQAKIDSVEGVLISMREKESINEKYLDVLPKVSALINNLNQAKQLQ